MGVNQAAQEKEEEEKKEEKNEKKPTQNVSIVIGFIQLKEKR